MTEQDYDAVRALWLTIRGFGIRALDDSREDIVRFIRRNPTTSVVAEMDGSIIGSILCGSDGRQGALYHVCVAKNYRRQGIAKALTSRLALEILKRDKAPFYCCAWSNIRSARNAVACGFSPAWAEMSVKPAALVDDMNGN